MHDDDDADPPPEQLGDFVRITLAETKDIFSWSYGEVTAAELFDPEQQTFHPDGLFSEKLFGRLRKYDEVLKKYRDADRMARFVKTKWNMDVMNPERCRRFAHLALPVPVIHPWFWGHDDAPLELLLGMPHRRLRDIVCGRVAIDLFFPGPHLSYRCQALDDAEQARLACEPTSQDRTGAAAISEMLARLNYRALYEILRERQAASGSRLSSRQSRRLEQRITLVRAVVEQRLAPLAFVLDALPVLPVACRGLQLGRDGKVRTDWLTAAYRRIIRVSDRYRAVVDGFIGRSLPTRVELYQTQRRRIELTCEIEWLFAELLRRGSPMRRDRYLSRPPRLSWRNSFPAAWWPVVPDPELRLHQCRIPCQAWDQQVGNPDPELEIAFGLLPSSLPPTLLELAPMKSPRDLAVLQPMLCSDRAIHVHPQLLCSSGRSAENPSGRFLALRSDATQQDGDRLAFPVRSPQSLPVSFETLPAELAVGCTLATRWPAGVDENGNRGMTSLLELRDPHPVFASFQAVADAWEAGRISLTEIIVVRLPPSKEQVSSERQQNEPARVPASRLYCTTAGRVLINRLLPAQMPFHDAAFTRPHLRQLMQTVQSGHGTALAACLLEALSEFARHVLTRSGMSFSLDDLRPPDRLAEVMKELDAKHARAQKMLHRGVISSAEGQYLMNDACSHAKSRAESEIAFHLFGANCADEPLRIVAVATRSITVQMLQSLCGIPGFVYRPDSNGLHFIRSNYHSGLSMLEYFSASAAQRGGRMESHSHQQDAAALCGPLVNLLRDAVITEEDCGTSAGYRVVRLGRGQNVHTATEFRQAVVGRVSLERIGQPHDANEPIVSPNEAITPSQARLLETMNVPSLRIRHTLHCEARRGVCRKCYGVAPDKDDGELAELGLTIGLRTALAIGSLLERRPTTLQPLSGGADHEAAEARARQPGVVSLKHVKLLISRSGERFSLTNPGRIEVLDESGEPVDQQVIPQGSLIPVSAGDRVDANAVLATWSSSRQPVFSRCDGRVQIKSSRKSNWTLLSILDSSGAAVDGCLVPSTADVVVHEAEPVPAGTLIAEVFRNPAAKSPPPGRDLAAFRRILSLRPPRHPAVLAESDGTVELEYDGASSCCAVRILRPDAVAVRQVIRLTRQRTVIVRTGDNIEPGDPLTTGEVDLTQLVRLKGPEECYRRLHDELRQCVPYMNRPEAFDVRHFELLLTQLFRWVEVASAGDSGFVSGQIVPKGRILAKNKRLRTMSLPQSVPSDARDVPEEPISREDFEALRTRLLSEHPESVPIQPAIPWPAGWIPLLRGWKAAAACSGSPFSSGGFFPTKAALIEAALGGWSEEFSGVKDAVLIGRPMQAGTGLQPTTIAEGDRDDSPE